MAKGKVQFKEDVEALHKAIISERGDDTIILIVPSHDSNNKKLHNQDIFAGEALSLFGKLYGGATAFHALQGIWIDEKGKEIFDEPILIQSLAKREDAANEEKLELLSSFANRMCREMKQGCVGIICNETFHYLYSKSKS